MLDASDFETKSHKTLRLLVKGFTGFDERLIDGVVKLSKRRNPSLELVDANTGAEADIVLINGKDAQAVAWAHSQQTWLARQAVVWVDAQHELAAGHTSLRRPVNWTNLPFILVHAMEDAERLGSRGAAAAASAGRTEADEKASSAAGAASSLEKQGLAAAAARLSAQTNYSVQPSPPPASQVQAVPSAKQVAAPAARLPAKAPNILVVDDSAAVRGHLESALKAVGYDVTCVDSGEAAIVAVGAWAYDCILMDVLMPGIDGYEASRRIKAMPLNGRDRRPPVVMLTSKVSPFDRIRGKLAGCDAYLTKPVQRAHLMQVLAEHAFKHFQRGA